MSYIILLLATSRLFLIILKNVSDKSHPMPSLEIKYNFYLKNFLIFPKRNEIFLVIKLRHPI